MADWASDSGHYYHRDGTPCYTIVGANGKERDTTLRDARKLNLLPSYSTVSACAARPGLDAYKQRQILLAALTLPRNNGENDDAYCKRILEDAKEHARKAAERGTAIHAALESHFLGQSVLDGFKPIVDGVVSALDNLCGIQKWLPEKSFAVNNPAAGYGCKIDLHSEEWLWDFKTKEFGPEDLPDFYDEHPMQLAAGTFAVGNTKMRSGIAFISATHPGLVRLVEATTELTDRGWHMFRALLDFWWAKNGTETYHR